MTDVVRSADSYDMGYAFAFFRSRALSDYKPGDWYAPGYGYSDGYKTTCACGRYGVSPVHHYREMAGVWHTMERCK